GKSTKLVRKSISTAAMAKLGMMYGNLLLNLQVTCKKRLEREEPIRMEKMHVDRATAPRLMDGTDGHGKRANVIGMLGLDGEEAQRRLHEVEGVIGRLIPDLDAA